MQALVKPLIAPSTDRVAKRPQRTGLLTQKSSLVIPAGESTTLPGPAYPARHKPTFVHSPFQALLPALAARCEESIDLTQDQRTLVVNQPSQQIAPLLSRSQEMDQLNTLLLNDQITDDQRSWSSILPVPDNSMAPSLMIGGYIVAYLLDSPEYTSRVGKVVMIRLASSPDTYQVGRLKSINRKSLTLSYDSADVSDLVLPLRDVRQLLEGVYSLGNQVL